MEIFVPIDGFNGYFVWTNHRVTDYIPESAYKMAEKFHPTYNKLKPFTKKLMARNSMQIFGPDMNDPVEFVICYTHDGKASGGTGQAIRIAEHYDIKVYNLHNVEDFKAVQELVSSPQTIS